MREKSYWCQVLHRIINVTLTLAISNLPFRGHRGSNGNFLSIIELLAIYDPVLKHLISKPKNSIKYFSPQIQNEIIGLLSQTVENRIVSAIKDAPFFSIIMDTTQDITKVDQLSQVFRYVHIEKDDTGKPIDISDLKQLMTKRLKAWNLEF